MKSSSSKVERLDYLDRTLTFDLTGMQRLGEIRIKTPGQYRDGVEEIREALLKAIGQTSPLTNRVRPGEKVVLVVSDWTRRTGMEKVLPLLIHAWQENGVAIEDLSILFACGAHRACRPQEQRSILGAELYEALKGRLVNNDAYDTSAFIERGRTRRATPVQIHQLAIRADKVFLTGTVTYHYFGGFGGGRKSVLPGIASAESISANHSLNIDRENFRINPDVRIGRLAGNPVSEDMAEAAGMLRVEAVINTVCDSAGRIVRVFAGDLFSAHEQATRLAEQLYRCDVSRRADVVIAVSHAANWIQSHKCLYNASELLAPGGVIILLAPCPEGVGSERFLRWIRLGNREAILKALCRQSEINGQTALSTLTRGPSAVILTELSEQQAGSLKMTKAATPAEAVRFARQRLAKKGNRQPTVWIMPDAAYTVPMTKKEVLSWPKK